MTTSQHRLRIVFAFPPMAGHFNPSLSLARELAREGHDVHYFCHDSCRKMIESVGATCHSSASYQTDQRFDWTNPFGVFEGLMQEHGVKAEGNDTGHMLLSMTKVSNLVLEVQVPGALKFLKEIQPDVVVYDPMMLCRDAYFAAQLLEIPTVSILTVAGPGGLRDHFMSGVSPETWYAEMEAFSPHAAATERLNAKYAFDLPAVARPAHLLEKPTAHLVTTSEDLQDPMTPRLASAYKQQDARFVYVGPLLDKEGSLRLGMSQSADDQSSAVLAAVQAAKAADRRVVMVSMGTVLTSDAPGTGWDGRAVGADGQPRGLSGRELCQAAWQGAFDAFGAASAEDGPLLVAALGNRADAFDGMAPPPPNAMCSMGLPQVDLLRLGVDAFLTHGGQNSFMEAMSNGTPVVVCPGFGDQVVNGQKAVALGVGLQVARPDCEPRGQEAAVAQYRSAVRDALLEVCGQPHYKTAALACASGLEKAGGVPRATEVIVNAASAIAMQPLACAGA